MVAQGKRPARRSRAETGAPPWVTSRNISLFFLPVWRALGAPNRKGKRGWVGWPFTQGGGLGGLALGYYLAAPSGRRTQTTPGCGYEDGDPYAAFLPPAVPTDANGGAPLHRAVVIVTEHSLKGTERSRQEYVSPLLVLTGEEYARVTFEDLCERICYALRGNRAPVVMQSCCSQRQRSGGGGYCCRSGARGRLGAR